MSKLLKKKAKKTKGKKPKHSGDLFIKTDLSKAEGIVIGHTTRAPDPDRVEVTEFGQEQPTYLDTESGPSLTIGNDSGLTIDDSHNVIISSDPHEDMTMRYNEPLTSWLDTEEKHMRISKSEMMARTYGSRKGSHIHKKLEEKKIDVDEMVELIRESLGNDSKSSEIAKKFENFGSVLEEVMSDEFSDEDIEPDEEFRSDEDYYMRYRYDDHCLPDDEPTMESKHFMQEMAMFLGYDETAELMAEALNISMDEALDIRLTQHVTDLTIAKAREILGAGGHLGKIRGDKGRCESIW